MICLIMEEKKIKKKKLTLSVSSNKIHNVPHYAQDRKKTSVVVGKKTSQNDVIKNDEDLMQYLLESEGVAGVHGEAFGLSPYFRLSYATDEKTLIEACDRIERACRKLR